jgi:hypothetical protein
MSIPDTALMMISRNVAEDYHFVMVVSLRTGPSDRATRYTFGMTLTRRMAAFQWLPCVVISRFATAALVSCLLLVVTVNLSATQAVTPQGAAAERRTASGSWSALSSAGLTLGGTWTAAVDPATGAVTGTWTLVAAKGFIATRGAWSASKAPTGWRGAWRAVADGRKEEHSGTWTAAVDLTADASFAELFTKAVESAVTGSWRAASRSGAWSIRAFK